MEVTTNAPSSNSPSESPTTSAPSTSPTERPSISPIVLGTPTKSPVISPTSTPSISPTDKLTLEPTYEPSHLPTLPPSPPPTHTPSSSPIDKLEILSAELKIASPDSTVDLDDVGSIQYRAMDWLVDNVDYDTYTSSQKVQRWALATFYRSKNGGDWVDNGGWLEDDDTGDDECASWYGVVCNANGLVTEINLSMNNVGGEIPREIALLEKLGELLALWIHL